MPHEGTWHYENGQWSETTFLDDAREQTEGSDWGTMLKSLGYEHYTGIGVDGDSLYAITVYNRDDPPRFLVDIGDLNRGHSVTAGTLPDALDLLARYAPIVTAAEIADAFHDIRNLEPHGIVTDILASAEVNGNAVLSRVEQERQARVTRRRAAMERKTQKS